MSDQEQEQQRQQEDGNDDEETFFVAVHVGAGYHAPSNEKALRSAMKRACLAAASLLRRNGSSGCIDAVTAAIQVLENDPITNAGRGSNLTEDGRVECDASIMDGNSGVFGAVGAMPGVKNPIKVAALLAKEQMLGSSLFGRIPPIFLVGEGARIWAKTKGIALSENTSAGDEWLVTERAKAHWRKYKGMVDDAKAKTETPASGLSSCSQEIDTIPDLKLDRPQGLVTLNSSYLSKRRIKEGKARCGALIGFRQSVHSGTAQSSIKTTLSKVYMAALKPGVIALFDVDGTLTAPRKEVTPQMLTFMRELRKVVTVGIVGGSDLIKITEQLGKTVIDDHDYVFSENGLVAHKDGKLIGTQSLKTHLGDDKLKEFINFTLHYIADLDIPIKRGTFIEFRSGMINVSPIGRNCSQEERDDFEKYDKIHNIRPKMVSILREKFAHLNLTFSIGGQISFDVFPQGWDKTYCLRYLDDFQDIHFFGDKTYKGGNDHEIYESERTVGHTVTSPEDTIKQCKALFLTP